MKKIVLSITAIAASVVIGSIAVAAAPGIGTHQTVHKTDLYDTADTSIRSACGNYTDTNGDGICDNCHSSDCYSDCDSVSNSSQTDTSVYQACGNYTDTNGDGICDNCHSSGCYSNNTCSQSHHGEYGHHGHHGR